jgi:serpin B
VDRVPAARTLARSSARFALDLYAHLRAQPGNLVLSPLGISAAFGMAAAGAVGRTRGEIEKALHFPDQAALLHPPLGALLRSVHKAAARSGQQLELTQRLWLQRGAADRGSFPGLCRRHYGAEAVALDFHGDSEGARREVNAWLSERTRGRVPELLLPGSVGPLTGMVLASAAWFQGRWAVPFAPGRTTPEAFHPGRAVSCRVPTMHARVDAPLGRIEGGTALELRFAGAELSMLLLLPEAADGLPGLEGRLSPEALERWLAGLAPQPVEVALPRFGFPVRLALRQALGALGVRAAFHPGRADFAHVGGASGLALENVWHEGFVSVDEAGAEAAAAAPELAAPGPPEPPARFTADHPFLFLIRERASGAILFLGRVADPSRS